MLAQGREPNTGRILFEQGPRISESKHIDMDEVCLTPDLNPKDLPHMLPTPVGCNDAASGT